MAAAQTSATSGLQLPADTVSGATLRSFAMFNPTISLGEESAEDNVLWYHPPNEDVDVKLRSVGLCTAMTSFSSKFGCPSVRSVTTDAVRYVMLQVEPNFWFAAAVNRTASREYEDDHDNALTDVAIREMQVGYAMLEMTVGTLAMNLATAVEAEDAEEGERAAAARRPKRKQKYWIGAVAERMRALLLPHGVNISARLAASVERLTGSLGVKDGLEYLSAGAVGCLHVGSFARRLHNAHPSTVAHSVIVLGDKVAHSTLAQTTTATLLRLVWQAESELRQSAAGLQPDVVYPPVGAGSAPSPAAAAEAVASIWSRVSSFWGQDATAAANDVEPPRGRPVVYSHNAVKKCWIDGRPVGLLCFKQGDFSLYCVVDEKFCSEDTLRRGLTENVAAILHADGEMLLHAERAAKYRGSVARNLDESVVYTYQNSVNLASKSSPHIRKGTMLSGSAYLTTHLDRLRHAEVAAVAQGALVSITAKVGDGATDSTRCEWAFVDKMAGREFCFAFAGKPTFESAHAYADEVRNFALGDLMMMD